MDSTNNFEIWARAQGRFAMIAFWALIGTYAYVKYLT